MRKPILLTLGAVLTIGLYHAAVQTDNERPRPLASIPSVGSGEPWNDENDVVMGLARYDQVDSEKDYSMRVFVGSLRKSGYKGRIVLWVHENLAAPPVGNDAMQGLHSFMAEQRVELVAVAAGPCDISFAQEGGTSGLRGLCSPEYPSLPLEWYRFAVARDWLKANPKTQWALLSDIRDAYFQRPPFSDLGPPRGERTMVFSEYFGSRPGYLNSQGKKRGVDASHWFAGGASKCYGHTEYDRYKHRDMICSGQVLGTPQGLQKFLDAYVGEMLQNSKKGAQCFPPVLPDQPLMMYLIYTGKIEAEVVPYGVGPVMNLGIPCTWSGRRYGLRDLFRFDEEGYILDAAGRRAPMLHQYDRCENWMKHWLRLYMDRIGAVPLTDEEQWVSEKISLPAKGAKNATKVQNPNDPGWDLCGAQGDLCTCGTKVRFGDESSSRWDVWDFEGETMTVLCQGGVHGGAFGEPAPMMSKTCQCKRA